MSPMASCFTNLGVLRSKLSFIDEHITQKIISPFFHKFQASINAGSFLKHILLNNSFYNEFGNNWDGIEILVILRYVSNNYISNPCTEGHFSEHG